MPILRFVVLGSLVLVGEKLRLLHRREVTIVRRHGSTYVTRASRALPDPIISGRLAPSTEDVLSESLR